MRKAWLSRQTLRCWLTDYWLLAGWSRWLTAVQLRLSPSQPWVAILGIDGTGKTTVLQALQQALSVAPLAGVVIVHRRPAVLYTAGKQSSSTIEHYSKPAHGPLKSVLKLIVMTMDWFWGYWGGLVHQRARGYLLLSDRHSLLDLLVDPMRYRYGGPSWLVRLALRCAPKPDIVILLDAPVDVLRRRKQELAPEEAARQQNAYRQLLQTLPGGQVVDATRPVRWVVAEIEQIIVRSWRGTHED